MRIAYKFNAMKTFIVFCSISLFSVMITPAQTLTTLVWFDTAGRHQESLDSERPVGEQLLTHFYRSVTSLVRQGSYNVNGLRSMFKGA